MSLPVHLFELGWWLPILLGTHKPLFISAECPLEFGDPLPVAKTCGCSIAPSNMTCCRALDSYLLTVQQQMLITNLQALRCVTLLASMLQNMSVSADIYSLCAIDLKDFSLQGSVYPVIALLWVLWNVFFSEGAKKWVVKMVVAYTCKSTFMSIDALRSSFSFPYADLYSNNLLMP